LPFTPRPLPAGFTAELSCSDGAVITGITFAAYGYVFLDRTSKSLNLYSMAVLFPIVHYADPTKPDGPYAGNVYDNCTVTSKVNGACSEYTFVPIDVECYPPVGTYSCATAGYVLQRTPLVGTCGARATMQSIGGTPSGYACNTCKKPGVTLAMKPVITTPICAVPNVVSYKRAVYPTNYTTSYDVVTRACMGKETCSVDADTGLFGDPPIWDTDPYDNAKVLAIDATCTQYCSTSAPSAPNAAVSTVYNVPGNRARGSTATYKCNAGYYMASGSSTSTCDVGVSDFVNPTIVCSACGIGYYCPGDGARYTCGEGTYSTRTTDSSSMCSGYCEPGYRCLRTAQGAPASNAFSDACGGTGNFVCPRAAAGADASWLTWQRDSNSFFFALPTTRIAVPANSYSGPLTLPVNQRYWYAPCLPNRACAGGLLLPGFKFNSPIGTCSSADSVSGTTVTSLIEGAVGAESIAASSLGPTAVFQIETPGFDVSTQVIWSVVDDVWNPQSRWFTRRFGPEYRSLRSWQRCATSSLELTKPSSMSFAAGRNVQLTVKVGSDPLLWEDCGRSFPVVLRAQLASDPAFAAECYTTVNVVRKLSAPLITNCEGPLDVRRVPELQIAGTSVGAPLMGTQVGGEQAGVVLRWFLTNAVDGLDFAVDTCSGQVFTTRVLSRTTTPDSAGGDIRTLAITAIADGASLGMGSLFATCKLEVNVTRVNQAPSVYDGTSLFVSELRPAATLVGTVQFGDPDFEDSLKVRASWASTDSRDPLAFAINPTSGDVTTYYMLDAIKSGISVYYLVVNVTDGTAWTTAPITITISPKPRPPVVLAQTLSLMEFTEDGSAPMTMAPLAFTHPLNDNVAWWLSPATPFTVSSGSDRAPVTFITYSGAQPLDYYAQREYTLTAFAQDSLGNIASATVTLVVGEANRRPALVCAPGTCRVPALTTVPSYNATVREYTRPGSALGLVIDATDSNKLDLLTYTLTSFNPPEAADMFALDSRTGVLRLATDLASPSTRTEFVYNTSLAWPNPFMALLSFEVRDNGTPSKASAGTIAVNVTNVRPRVQEATFSLPLDSASDTDLGVATMWMPAASPVGMTPIVWSLSDAPGDSSGASALAIDNTTGALYILNASMLEYNQKRVYRAMMQATYTVPIAGQAPSTVDTADATAVAAIAAASNTLLLTSSALVTFILTHVNRAPEWVNVTRVYAPFRFPGRVGPALASYVRDLDSALLDVAERLQFSITSGNSADAALGINATTGGLIVLKPLSPALAYVQGSPAPTLFPTVMVCDRGIDGPVQCASQVFPVEVQETNYPPTLDDAVVTVAENSAVNMPVGAALVASDPDAGTRFRYSILKAIDSTFRIDASSGQIFVNGSDLLDFELRPVYTITVQVLDSGTPPLIATAQVTIRLLDVNEAPALTAVGPFFVPENSVMFTGVGRIAATDPDVADAGKLKYSIVDDGIDTATSRLSYYSSYFSAYFLSFPGATMASILVPFVVNAETGALNVSGMALNFELQSSYSITVRVTDAGGLTNDAIVLITLTNRNDAPSLKDFDWIVTENMIATLLDLSADDDDIGQAHHYSFGPHAASHFCSAWMFSSYMDSAWWSTGGAQFYGWASTAPAAIELRLAPPEVTVDFRMGGPGKGRISLSGSVFGPWTGLYGWEDRYEVEVDGSSGTASIRRFVGRRISVSYLRFSYWSFVSDSVELGTVSSNAFAASSDLTLSDFYIRMSGASYKTLTIGVRSSNELDAVYSPLLTVTDTNDALSAVRVDRKIHVSMDGTTAQRRVTSVCWRESPFVGLDWRIDLNQATGWINSYVLDYESRRYYGLEVLATDLPTGRSLAPFSLTGTGVVQVSVLDANEPPAWPSTAIVQPSASYCGGYVSVVACVTLPENSVGGTVVAQVPDAVDPDIFRVQGLVYSLQQTNVVESARIVTLTNQTTWRWPLSTLTNAFWGTYSYSVGASSQTLVVANSGLLNFEAQAGKPITLRVWVNDAGWDNTLSSAPSTIVIYLSDVNEAPSLAPLSTGAWVVPENSALNTLVGQPSFWGASDPDTLGSSWATLQYSITGGTGLTIFAVNAATGQLSLSKAVNFEAKSNYTIAIRVTDGGGLTASTNITILVTNVNEAPTITIPADGTVTVSENWTSTFPASFGVTDVDANSLHSWSVAFATMLPGKVSGFLVFATTGCGVGQLTVAPGVALDFEKVKSYIVRLKVTDNGVPPLSATRDMTVTVIDSNEAPTVTSKQEFTISEGASNRTVLGQVSWSDPDFKSATKAWGTPSFSLASEGNVNGYFNISSSTGVLSVGSRDLRDVVNSNDDFAVVVSLTVIITDGGGLRGSGVVSVRVLPINYAPKWASSSVRLSVDEATASFAHVAGDAMGSPFVATDRNSKQVGFLSFSLTSRAWAASSSGWKLFSGGFFAVASSSNLGQAQMSLTEAGLLGLDFETTPFYIVEVEVTDPVGESAITNVTIAVVNHNEAPTISYPSSASVLENSTVGTRFGPLPTARDPENDVLTYTIVSGDPSNSFGVDASGALFVQAVLPAYEQASVYTLTVAATDSGAPDGSLAALSGRTTISVNIGHVNKRPVWQLPLRFFTAGLTVPENSAQAAVVAPGSLLRFVAEPDADDVQTFSIDRAAWLRDNFGSPDVFGVDAATGAIVVAGALDYELRSGYRVTLVTTDTGNLSASVSFDIAVSNVNEPPYWSTDPAGKLFTLLTTGATVGVPQLTVVSDQDLLVASNSERLAFEISSFALSFTPTIGGARTVLDPALFPGLVAIDAISGQMSLGHVIRFPSLADAGARVTVSALVIVSDASGLFATRQIQFNTTDNRPAPTCTDVSLTVSENSPTGTVVGSVSCPGGTGVVCTFSISLAAGESAAMLPFTIASLGSVTTGTLLVGPGAAPSFLDYEARSAESIAAGSSAAPVYSLIAVVSDNDADFPLTGTCKISVTLTNVNEAPFLRPLALAPAAAPTNVFVSKAVRYVRITSASSIDALSFGELEVRDTSGANIASGKASSMSSSSGLMEKNCGGTGGAVASVAANGNDGNSCSSATTGLASAAGGVPQWWQVDLGSPLSGPLTLHLSPRKDILTGSAWAYRMNGAAVTLLDASFGIIGGYVLPANAASLAAPWVTATCMTACDATVAGSIATPPATFAFALPENSAAGTQLQLLVSGTNTFLAAASKAAPTASREIDALGLAVHVTASDADTADTLRFSLVPSASTPAGLFAVDPVSGRLAVSATASAAQLALLNFEAATGNTFLFTIIVTDAVGLTDSATVSVQLTDVNDAPVPRFLENWLVIPTLLTAPVTAALSAYENLLPATFLGRLRVMDEDAGAAGTLTYTLLRDAESSIFTVDPKTGVVALSNSSTFDWEDKVQWRPRLTVSDASASPLSVTVTLTINVLDVADAAVYSAVAGGGSINVVGSAFAASHSKMAVLAPSSGGAAIQFSGSNFGFTAARLVTEGLSENSPATVTASYGPLTGTEYTATACVIVASELLTCNTTASAGALFFWRFSFRLPGASSASTVSTADTIMTGVLPPLLTSVGLVTSAAGTTALVGGLATMGGSFAAFRGTGFGPVETAIVVRFAPATSPDDLTYSAPSAACAVTVAHTTVVCSIPGGVGRALRWSIAATIAPSQVSAILASSLSYDAPVIMGVNGPSNLDTAGGESFTVLGRNFGPRGSGPVSLTYAPSAVWALSPAVRNNAAISFFVITATSCTIMSDSAVTCVSGAGVGTRLLLRLEVAAQADTSTTNYVDYGRPTITALTGQGIERMPTTGGVTFVITGTGFGPAYDISSEDSITAILGKSFVRTPAVSYGQMFVEPTAPIPPAPAGSECTFTRCSPAQCGSVVATCTGRQYVLTLAPAGQVCFETQEANGAIVTTFISATDSRCVAASPSTALPALSCYISSPHTGITCTAGAGVGKWMYASIVAIGGSASPSPFLGSVLSYAPPVITSFEGEGARLAATAGGQMVVIKGLNFGSSQLAITAVGYGIDGAEYVAPGCVLVVPHTEIQCTTVPGAGARLAWTVKIANQVSVTPVTDYSPPEITAISGDGSVDAFTNGGQDVVLTGTNFATQQYLTSVNYGPTGTEFAAVGCIVTVQDTEITCLTVAGTGRKLFWTVTVRGQASFLSPVTSSYAAPMLSYLSVTTGSTAGTSSVMLVGYDLGAAVATAYIDLLFNRYGVSTPIVAMQDEWSAFNDALLAGDFTAAFDNMTANVGSWFQLPPLPLKALVQLPGRQEAIYFDIPDGCGIARELIIFTDGVPSNPVLFNYLQGTVLNVAPVQNSAGGLTVFIEGINFCGAPSVIVGGPRPPIMPVSVVMSETAVVSAAGCSADLEALGACSEEPGSGRRLAAASGSGAASSTTITVNGITIQPDVVTTALIKVDIPRPANMGTNPTTIALPGTSKSDAVFTAPAPKFDSTKAFVTPKVAARELQGVSVPISSFAMPTSGGARISFPGVESLATTDAAKVTVLIGGRNCTDVTLDKTAGVDQWSYVSTVSCLTPPGVGANLTVVMSSTAALGGSSPAWLNRFFWYAAPTISNVQDGTASVVVGATGAAVGIPTAGTRTLRITGTGFGDPAVLGPEFLMNVQLTIADGAGGTLPLTCTVLQQTDTSALVAVPEGYGAPAILVIATAGVPAGGLSGLGEVYIQPSPAIAVAFASPRITSAIATNTLTSGGAVLTLVGANFGPQSMPPVVTVAGEACPVTDYNHTRLLCTLPAGQGANVLISVTVAGLYSPATGTGSARFSYSPPSLAAVMPLTAYSDARAVGAVAGSAATTMRISGANFGLSPSVTLTPAVGSRAALAGVTAITVLAAAMTSVSHTALTFPVPAGLGSGLAIAVIAGGQTSTGPSFVFSYAPPAVISAVRQGRTTDACTKRIEAVPRARDGTYVNRTSIGQCYPTVGGFVLTVTGVSFGPPNATLTLTLGGVPCTVISHTHNVTLCSVASGMGDRLAMAISVGGQSSIVSPSTARFSYDDPVVTTVMPNVPNALGGERLVIQGYNFGGVSTPVVITLGGVPCTKAMWVNDSVVSCVAAAMSVGPKDFSVLLANRTTPFVYSAAEEVVVALCKTGYYGLVGEQCIDCSASEPGATCPGSELDADLVTAQPGWFRVNVTVPSESATEQCLPARLSRSSCPSFLPCFPASACLGSNACKLGYEGLRCASCSDGYYKLNGSCVDCPDRTSALVLAFVVAAILSIVILYLAASKGIVWTTANQAIDYAQVLALMNRFAIAWPAPIVSRWLSVASASFFNLELIAPECSIANIDLSGKWITVELLPVILAAVLAGSYIVQSLAVGVSSMFAGGSPAGPGRHHAFLATGLMLYRLMFVYIARNTLDVFDCAPLSSSKSQTLFLSSNLDIPCYVAGGTHMSMVGGGVAGIIVYLVIIPLAILWPLFKGRGLIFADQFAVARGATLAVADAELEDPMSPSSSFRRVFLPLYAPFRPGAWYWEFVIALRKFSIVLVSVMFNRTYTFQQALCLLMLFITAVLHVRAKPYFSADAAAKFLFQYDPSVMTKAANDARLAAVNQASDEAITAMDSEAATLASALRTMRVKRNVYALTAVTTRTVLLQRRIQLGYPVLSLFLDSNIIEAVLLASLILQCLAGGMFGSALLMGAETERFFSTQYRDLANATVVLLATTAVYILGSLLMGTWLAVDPDSLWQSAETHLWWNASNQDELNDIGALFGEGRKRGKQLGSTAKTLEGDGLNVTNPAFSPKHEGAGGMRSMLRANNATYSTRTLTGFAPVSPALNREAAAAAAATFAARAPSASAGKKTPPAPPAASKKGASFPPLAARIA